MRNVHVDHCSLEEWMEGDLYSAQYRVHMLKQALEDCRNGRFQMVVEQRPAYSDMGSDPIVVSGERGSEEIGSLVERAKVLFMERYNDHRPHAMMHPQVYMKFDSGFTYSYKWDDEIEEWVINHRL